MALNNTFTTMFDKAISNGHAHEYKNKWVVVEHENNATMNHLEVNATGDFLGFDHDLVKGVKDTTTRMSSKLDDKDCDGIAFLNDNSEQEHLVFAELKSNFDIQKITGAFHQITMSFVKMHAWLSLCKDYSLGKAHGTFHSIHTHSLVCKTYMDFHFTRWQNQACAKFCQRVNNQIYSKINNSIFCYIPNIAYICI